MPAPCRDWTENHYGWVCFRPREERVDWKEGGGEGMTYLDI
jgi:hypothetical protein